MAKLGFLLSRFLPQSKERALVYSAASVKKGSLLPNAASGTGFFFGMANGRIIRQDNALRYRPWCDQAAIGRRGGCQSFEKSPLLLSGEANECRIRLAPDQLQSSSHERAGHGTDWGK